MNMFKRLKYLFTASAELDILIKKEHDILEKKKREDQIHRLNLCWKHRQEQNRSSFSEHNCHYCQAQKHIEFLNKELVILKQKPNRGTDL